MKTIRMFFVAFIAMLLGTSFCNPVVAQSYDDIMAESIKSYMAESESELRDAGILSYDVRIQGSIIVCDLVFDENVAAVDSWGVIMNLAKEKAATEKQLGGVDEDAIGMLESLGYTYRYIIKGNKSGKIVASDFSVRELLVFGELFADFETLGKGLSIEEYVAMLDRIFANEDENLNCVLRGNCVYIELEMTKEEYDDMNELVAKDAGMVKSMLETALTGDKDAAEVFRVIIDKGYRMAYSFKCANEWPITINLDFSDVETSDDDLAIDEIVEMLDEEFVKEDENLRCVRRGDVIYFEYTASGSEYDELKEFVDDYPLLIKSMIESALVGDPDSVEFINMVTEMGYRFAYLIKCGAREPITVNLDF